MPDIEEAVAVQPIRRRLPDERKAIVRHFNVGGYEGYLTVGFYEDGGPGKSSSPQRRKARRYPALWIVLPPQCRSHFNTGCRSGCFATSSVTRGSNRADGQGSRKLDTPSPLWITSSAG